MSTTVSSSAATATARPSAKEVLAAVRDLQPWLREHQAAAENERRIPQETIELLNKAGVFQLTSPRRPYYSPTVGGKHEHYCLVEHRDRDSTT